MNTNEQGFRRSGCRSGQLPAVLGVVLLAAALTGCAASQEASGDKDQQAAKPVVARPGENGEPGCFYASQVRDFRAIGRSDLIVFAPNEKNAYQVRIAPPAMGLRFSDAVVFVSRNDRVCGYAGDDLVVDEAGGRQRYSIVEVARLSPGTVERLLGREAEPPAPEVRPGAGAEVERELEPVEP
jgi:hypothetical protein